MTSVLKSTIFLILCCGITASAKETPKKSPIRISMRLQGNTHADSLIITCQPMVKYNYAKWDTLRFNTGANQAAWEIKSAESIVFIIRSPQGKNYSAYLFPDDRVEIVADGNGFRVTGPGSERFRLLNDIILPANNILIPPSDNPTLRAPKDLREYDDWNRYFDQQTAIIQRSVDSFSHLYPSPNWPMIKTSLLAGVEDKRTSQFMLLAWNRKKYGLSHEQIRSMYRKYLQNDNQRHLFTWNHPAPKIEYYYKFLKGIQYYKSDLTSGKNVNEDDMDTYRLYLRDADSLFSPQVKDQFMVYYLLNNIYLHNDNDIGDEIKENFVAPKLSDRSLLQLIEREEAKFTRNGAQMGFFRSFRLIDEKGNRIDRKDLGNKVVVLSSISFAQPSPDSLFMVLLNKFAGHPGVFFGTVQTDSLTYEQWKKTHPVTKGASALYAPRTKDRFDYILNIHSALPLRTQTLYSYKPDYEHLEIRTRLPQGILDTTAAILDFISAEIVNMDDGPYVFYNGDSVIVHRFTTNRIKSDTIHGRLNAHLQVTGTNMGEHFTFPLKPAISSPPATYEQPDKMIVISDMEGNLPALTGFLMAHGVMDSLYRWTYGNGRLVVAGDFMDRGRQVNEVLWLLYKLENEATQDGGGLHFILGNHEMMNMTGDYGYVRNKYMINAAAMKRHYYEVYGMDSELGRWLRSRNMMEKIGPHLIVHGGISPEINQLRLPIDTCNLICRQYLKMNTKGPYTDSLLFRETSPLWYRKYYPHPKKKTDRTPSSAIDSTLHFYGADRIITGHTIVDDVSGFYGGKVINIDTHHASGDVEGLLVEKGKYYRITVDGQRHPLTIQP